MDELRFAAWAFYIAFLIVPVLGILVSSKLLRSPENELSEGSSARLEALWVLLLLNPFVFAYVLITQVLSIM